METKTLTFRGLEGYADFRHGQAYKVDVTREDDGTGEVRVSMPQAPGLVATFDAKQCMQLSFFKK